MVLQLNPFGIKKLSGVIPGNSYKNRYSRSEEYTNRCNLIRLNSNSWWLLYWS